MDQLSALRDFTIRNELDKIVRFGGDYAFPCSVATAYRSKQGNLYTLETLDHYVKNHLLKHTDYMHNARTQNLAAVTFIDRKPLLDYLEGKVSFSDANQFVAPQNPKFPSSYSAATAADEYRPEDPGLIPICANNDEFDVNEDARARDLGNYLPILRAVERPLKDQEIMLECRNRS